MESHPEPLLHCILQNLQQEPAATAILFGNTCISNAQLLHKICKLVPQLKASGITAGTLVAVHLERSPDIVVLLLALWCCEATYLPLDSSWPQARLNSVIEQAEPAFVITRAQAQEKISRLTCPALTLQAIDWDCEPADPVSGLNVEVLPRPDAAALAYVLFTSGSSGRPKGVMITHANLATVLHSVLPLLQLQTGGPVLGCASFSFDIVFFELLAPLLCTAPLVLADQTQYRDPHALVALIRQHNIAVVQATPALWSLLLQTPDWHDCQLQLAISTGEALPVRTASWIFSRTRRLWNLYGPTECSIWASAHQVVATDLLKPEGIIPIGRALPAYKLGFAAQDQEELASNFGELLISGSGVGAGYLQDAEQSAKVFTCENGQRVYHSGDCCSIDAEGCWHFMGRLDNQLKHNGYRIEADEIALYLQQHASIAQAVCLVRRSADGQGSQLLAFVVCKNNMPNKDRKRWNLHLAQWLPPWMLPDRYFMLNSLPLLASGKIDRQALLELADNKHTSAEQPDDALGASISTIFCDLLEIESIGPYDSFFDAGGNSMLSAALVLALNEKFSTRITLREALALPPTVNSMHQLVQQQLAQQQSGQQLSVQSVQQQ